MTRFRFVTTSLALSLLLLLCSDAQGQGNCTFELRVSRNTMISATANKSFDITCPVKHCGERREIRWCKLENDTWTDIQQTDHIKTELRHIDFNMREFILHFTSIRLDDAGIYHCIAGNVTIGESISHSINVSIKSINENPVNSNTSPGSTTGPPQQKDDLKWLPYVFICLGILVVVIIVVVISCLIVRGCEGSKQYTEENTHKTPAPKTTSQASPQPSLPDRPRSDHGKYCTPSAYSNVSDDNRHARRTPETWRGASSELPQARNSAPGEVVKLVDRRSAQIDMRGIRESCPIIYAALNHQATHGGPGPTHISLTTEEGSEYAAIRVS